MKQSFAADRSFASAGHLAICAIACALAILLSSQGASADAKRTCRKNSFGETVCETRDRSSGRRESTVCRKNSFGETVCETRDRSSGRRESTNCRKNSFGETVCDTRDRS
ncbi:MAG: hypothetical protein LBQ12_04755, partial [Deltaproteobacteria bacterium]|nr:hypothetical protein [Deltaproteobacteria bacterium]